MACCALPDAPARTRAGMPDALFWDPLVAELRLWQAQQRCLTCCAVCRPPAPRRRRSARGPPGRRAPATRPRSGPAVSPAAAATMNPQPRRCGLECEEQPRCDGCGLPRVPRVDATRCTEGFDPHAAWKHIGVALRQSTQARFEASDRPILIRPRLAFECWAATWP